MTLCVRCGRPAGERVWLFHGKPIGFCPQHSAGAEWDALMEALAEKGEEEG